jgi:NADH:ubiquinone oxidoreductase subunit E
MIKGDLAMVKITVCIGSSCHMKGSRQIIEELQYLIRTDNLDDNIELAGAFCMGKCGTEGVSITVNGEYFSLKAEDTKKFFEEVILKKIS